MDEKVKEFLEREGIEEEGLELVSTYTYFFDYQNKKLAQLAMEVSLGMSDLRQRAVDLLLTKAGYLEEPRVDMDIRDLLEQEQ